jgi:hypothetical protein
MKVPFAVAAVFPAVWDPVAACDRILGKPWHCGARAIAKNSDVLLCLSPKPGKAQPLLVLLKTGFRYSRYPRGARDLRDGLHQLTCVRRGL